MIGMIKAFENFLTIQKAENNNTMILCKHCLEKVSTHVIESMGGSEGYSCETIVECNNNDCIRPRENLYDRKLQKEDVIIMSFNTRAEYEAYEERLSVLANIRWYKDHQANFKVITKRKGQKQHYCRLCKQEIMAGIKVHAHSESGCSFRGRHFSIQNYICETCWDHYILPTAIVEIKN